MEGSSVSRPWSIASVYLFSVDVGWRSAGSPRATAVESVQNSRLKWKSPLRCQGFNGADWLLCFTRTGSWKCCWQLRWGRLSIRKVGLWVWLCDWPSTLYDPNNPVHMPLTQQKFCPSYGWGRASLRLACARSECLMLVYLQSLGKIFTSWFFAETWIHIKEQECLALSVWAITASFYSRNPSN